MRDCLASSWANPSSTHRPGLAARHVVERARAQVAQLLRTTERSVIFTSGGTESVMLAILGSWRVGAALGRPIIVTTSVEHSSVLAACATAQSLGATVIRLAVNHAGLIDVEALSEILARDGDRIALVSVQFANNETGVLQDIERIASMCRRAGVVCHTDATQAVGRVLVDVPALGIDFLSCSAHKFHGPKGVGVLIARAGAEWVPWMDGSQERGRRAGTENVPAITGMGVAASLAQSWLTLDDGAQQTRMGLMRDGFEQSIVEGCAEFGAVVNGDMHHRVWSTTNIGFPRLEAEALVLLLSERRIAVGAGAACASGSLEPSPVLRAMGIDDVIAHGSIRLSVSRETTADELRIAAEQVIDAVRVLSRSASSVRGRSVH